MTNRTREFFDFAQMEPLGVPDMVLILRDCDEDEINEVEQVATNILAAVAGMGLPAEDLEITEDLGGTSEQDQMFSN